MEQTPSESVLAALKAYGIQRRSLRNAALQILMAVARFEASMPGAADVSEGYLEHYEPASNLAARSELRAAIVDLENRVANLHEQVVDQLYAEYAGEC